MGCKDNMNKLITVNFLLCSSTYFYIIYILLSDYQGYCKSGTPDGNACPPLAKWNADDTDNADFLIREYPRFSRSTCFK
jgi:hypothetical protein